MAIHLELHEPAREAEPLGRAGLVPRRRFERLLEALALEARDRLGEREATAADLLPQPFETLGTDDGFGEVSQIDRLTFGERERAVERVLEFADVPGPVVAFERRERRGREPVRAPLAGGLGAGKMRLGEEPDVLAPLSKRWEPDRQHVDPVEEILAEASRLDLALEIAVRGCDHAHVDRDGARPAEPFDAPLLQRAQELRLDGRRELADLIEEEGSSRCGLEATDLLLAGIGERTPFVAEELALDERFGKRRAAQGDEGRLAARRELVERARHEFLAGTALAEYEDRGLRGRRTFEGAEDLLHPRTLTDEAPEPRAAVHLEAEPFDLPLEFPTHERVFDLDPQRVDLEGLRHVVERSESHGLDGGRDRAERRQHDHRRSPRPLGKLAKKVEPTLSGHHEIEQHEIGGPAHEQIERRVGARRDRDLASLLEGEAEHVLHARLVVDDQETPHVPPVRALHPHCNLPESESENVANPLRCSLQTRSHEGPACGAGAREGKAMNRDGEGVLRRELSIGGEWRKGSGAERLRVVDPATGEAFAEVESASVADALDALEAARAAQPLWARRAPRERSEILRRAHELLLENVDRIARLIVRENGKILAEAKGEVVYAAEFFRWFSEEAVRLDGSFGDSPGGAYRMLVKHEPIGVALLVTPWNLPAAMATRKIAPALAAGCAVVLKPAPETPLTALAVMEVLEEAGVPAGIVNVIPTSESAAVVDALLSDPRLRKLSFTGSTQTGRILLARAAGRVVKCSMELGGNAPFVVFADADLDAAIEGALVAKLRHNAEACTAANRFYVEAPLADAFVSRLADAMRRLRLGPGLASGSELGPLVSEAARQKVAGLVAKALGHGAELVTGGVVPEGPGFFYPPTVVDRVRPDSPILREEIFGPVAPIVRFEAGDPIERMANDTEHGLVAYVYTRDLARGLRFAEALEAGMVGINRGLVSDPAAPFGGMKQSGIGREGGHEGIFDYTETKYVALSF